MITHLSAFFTPWIIYALLTLLHHFLPGRWMSGYVRDTRTGEVLHYRLNGRLVLMVAIVIWLLLGYLGWVPYDWLYLIGAVMLELNVLSFAAHQFSLSGKLPAGIWVCCAMLTFFVFDYLTFEKVHLYTYDFFAERVGMKLGWGCLTFYPFFYLISLWSTADLPDAGTSAAMLLLYGLIFLVGWTLSRGANLQKYYFKTRPQHAFLGIKPESITDGKNSLLVNGFWGLSRHINYLGEVLMGVGIALSTGYPELLWVWLYPLYYVLLLIGRQLDDDKRCAAKYGDLWKDYQKKVRYRIIPYVY
jgi:delta14-sterol reductase